MAKSRRRGKKGKYPLLTLILIIFAALFMANSDGDEVKDFFTGNTKVSDEEVYVHFVDVGQGSATLIQQGNIGILIDAGESDYGEVLADYINACGVDSLEYVIASHPHSDHIGGMLDVFKRFPVGRVIMPELEEFNTPTTMVYENFLEYIITNDIAADFIGNTGSYTYGFGESIDLEFLGPVEQVEDLNNMSLICRLRAFDTTFMILGDAEKPELSSVYENPMNGKVTAFDIYNPFHSDVLVMGHHGSSTSVHKLFLDAVDADAAVISCGKNNSYGHPHKEALNYIKKNAMTLYRTDTMGDIVFKCTAEGYEVID